MFRRGDIVAFDFPYADGSGSKLRPALILSNDSIEATGDVIIAMITTRKRETDITVELTKNMTDEPMLKPSFVKCHRLFAAEQSKIKGKLSQATGDAMDKIIKTIIGIIS